MDLILFLVGILVGMLIAYVTMVLCRPAPEEQIERIDRAPAYHEERREIMTVTAVTEIPNEFLINDPQRAIMELKYELGEAVWRYAMVSRIDNPRELAVRYRAVLKVVDMGRLNPFWKEHDRYG